MKKITASILTTLLMLSMVFSSSVFAANEETSAWDSFLGLFSAKASADDVGVEYRGHIQNVGDYPTDGSWIQGPERLGTVGKSLRLEAFWIKLTDAPEGLHIKYEVHVQNIGWMDPVEDGALAGTQGDSLRIEAIKISLVDDEGNVSGDYTVTYKGHIQNVGDTAWIKSGQQLGTTGSGLRLEALEVKIEKIAPDLTDYEAALAAVTEANYTKASWATYQDVVEDNVMTEDNVQSEVDAATAIILDAQEDLVTVPVIAGMTATAQKTITVTGTELSKLSASMFTVAGNTVTAVTPNADGTSATLTLGTDLTPETNTKVTATIDGTAKEYTVKYTIAAVTAAIQEGTFDDDKTGQSLTVLVDGVATTPAYLVAQGYTVTFNAWNENGSVNTTLLSSTGGIVVSPSPATIGDYTAQVTLAKGSTIVTSTKAAIKVRDLDNNADAISAYQITNQNATAPYIMNSTTLYSGETAFVNKVVVGYGAAAAELTTTFGAAGNYDVTSSNSAVISVNSTTKTMTATGLGTADITITVGNAKKVVTLTVVGEQRKIATVTGSTFTAIKGSTTTGPTVVVKDQYGDPFVGTSSLSITGPSITGVNMTTTTPVTSFTNNEGKLAIAIANVNADPGLTGVVVFRDADNNVVGSINVVTSNVNNATTKKLAIDTSVANSSTDDTIDTDLASDRIITYKVSLFNSDGVANGTAADLTGYQVIFNGSIVSVKGNNTTAAANTSGSYTLTNTGTADTRLIVTGLKAGTTTMVVKDNGGTVIDTRTITVLKGAPYITNVAFKAASTVNFASVINYRNVLDVTQTSNDDIVNGVTLSTASVYKVRIDKVGTFTATPPDTTPTGNIGQLYLDRNDDGLYNAGDYKLGTVSITPVEDTTGTTWDGVGNVWTGQNIKVGNKGTVTFKVTDTVSTTPVIRGTSTVTVNVPTVTGAVISGLTSPMAVSTTATAATLETGTITWSSSNTAVATIGASSGAVSTTATPGTTVISYTSTSGGTNSFTLVTGTVPATPSSSFTFNTGVLTSAVGTQYSLDGGTTWSAALTTANPTLSATELNSITAANGIQVKVAATATNPASAVQTITITTGATPAVTATTDGSFTLTGASNSTDYEYSTDGTTWTSVTSNAGGVITLPGAGTYQLRLKAATTVQHSAAQTGLVVS